MCETKGALVADYFLEPYFGQNRDLKFQKQNIISKWVSLDSFFPKFLQFVIPHSKMSFGVDRERLFFRGYF